MELGDNAQFIIEYKEGKVSVIPRGSDFVSEFKITLMEVSGSAFPVMLATEVDTKPSEGISSLIVNKKWFRLYNAGLEGFSKERAEKIKNALEKICESLKSELPDDKKFKVVYDGARLYVTNSDHKPFEEEEKAEAIRFKSPEGLLIQSDCTFHKKYVEDYFDDKEGFILINPLGMTELEAYGIVFKLSPAYQSSKEDKEMNLF